MPSELRFRTSLPWWSPSAFWTCFSTALDPSWPPALREALSDQSLQASPHITLCHNKLRYTAACASEDTFFFHGHPMRPRSTLCPCWLMVVEEGPMAIDGGRHPVLERTQQGTDYVVRNVAAASGPSARGCVPSVHLSSGGLQPGKRGKQLTPEREHFVTHAICKKARVVIVWPYPPCVGKQGGWQQIGGPSSLFALQCTVTVRVHL